MKAPSGYVEIHLTEKQITHIKQVVKDADDFLDNFKPVEVLVKKRLILPDVYEIDYPKEGPVGTFILCYPIFGPTAEKKQWVIDLEDLLDLLSVSVDRVALISPNTAAAIKLSGALEITGEEK